ncbi:MAG: homoserine kinase [Anaeromyxobacter sp.]|nr:homoserine kinase [Anaeromyxobacter sp.]MBL0276277.1 homoserine kinase [Anaeromyxobacter sp.]
MASYTTLSPADLAAACAAFGLPPPERVAAEPRGRVNTSLHLWAGGERWFLRLAEEATPEGVAFEAEVLRFLFEARFPVPQLRPAADGRWSTAVAGKPALLFAYAPGEEVERAAIGPERCRRIGEQLGRLHELSAGLTVERANPYGPARVAGWLEALGEGGADPEVRAALPLLRRELAATALPGAPRGLVHGDLFVDNVLWLGDRVGYLLDWEMACTEAFAWDLAVAVDAWCYGDRHDHLRAVALVEGYRSRRKLEPETVAALHPYARFQALRYAVGRLHTFRGGRPADGQAVWKDWRRYRDRLLALQAMGPAGYLDLLGLAR